MHRSGLLETITANQGTVSTITETFDFVEKMGMTILNSTPYYAQANGQTESSNRVIKGIMEKMVKDNPRDWDTLLSEALWAYRTSKRTSTGVTPFTLTYGHEAMLPMEVTVRFAKRALQNLLEPTNYTEAMIAELEELDEVKLDALDCLKSKRIGRPGPTTKE